MLSGHGEALCELVLGFEETLGARKNGYGLEPISLRICMTGLPHELSLTGGSRRRRDEADRICETGCSPSESARTSFSRRIKMACLCSKIFGGKLSQGATPAQERRNAEGKPRSYAVYTLHQNAQSVVKHPDALQIESSHLECERSRGRRIRQSVKIHPALFPT